MTDILVQELEKLALWIQNNPFTTIVIVALFILVVALIISLVYRYIYYR